MHTIACAIASVNSTRFDSDGYSCSMDIRDIRLQRLGQLLDEHNGNKAALARTLKKAPAQISQWFAGVRTITEVTAREIEHAAKRPVGWMDALPPHASLKLSGQHISPPPAPWPLPAVAADRFYRLPAEDRDKINTFAAFVAAERDRAGHKRHKGPAAA